MSTGDRLPYDLALKMLKGIADRMNWRGRLDLGTVGSLRRKRADIGDIEIIAPRGTKTKDVIFDELEEQMKPPGLYGGEDARETWLTPIKGFKRGFSEAVFWVTLEGATTKFTVYTHTEDNRGWLELYRIGPADIGPIFLSLWKKHWQIPHIQQASVDGHLVDTSGKIVPCRTEEQTWHACGISRMPKHTERDAWVAQMQARRAS